MKVSFFTRDLREDYPRIGWIPPIPDDASHLWERFENLTCGDYPELVLENDGSTVRAMLTAMTSGRTDSADGRGRKIRVSLYLEGGADEAGMFSGFVGTYLNEYLAVSKSGTRIQDFWAARIKQGDPTVWRDWSEEEQVRLVQEWMADFGQFDGGASRTCGVSYPHWQTGATPKGLAEFAAFCGDLLHGRRTGMAISLANLGAPDASRAVSLSRHTTNIALLFGGEGDDQLPISEIPQPRRPSENPMDPAHPSPNPMRRTFALIAVILAVIAAAWILKKVGQGSPAPAAPTGAEKGVREAPETAPTP